MGDVVGSFDVAAGRDEEVDLAVAEAQAPCEDVDSFADDVAAGKGVGEAKMLVVVVALGDADFESLVGHEVAVRGDAVAVAAAVVGPYEGGAAAVAFACEGAEDSYPSVELGLDDAVVEALRQVAWAALGLEGLDAYAGHGVVGGREAEEGHDAKGDRQAALTSEEAGRDGLEEDLAEDDVGLDG